MQVAIQLSNWQLAVLVVLPSLVSLAGWLNNNARIGDIRTDMNARFGELNSRLLAIDNRIDVLTGVVNDLDKRVIKIEERLHIEPL